MAFTALSLAICRSVVCTAAHAGSVLIAAERLFAAQRSSRADSCTLWSLGLVMMRTSDGSVFAASFDMDQSVAADSDTATEHDRCDPRVARA
jgi:hypothetical protein